MFCDGFVMKLDCLSSKQFTYQAANQISHILVVTGHVGSKNLLEQSFNVCSEGTFKGTKKLKICVSNFFFF